MKKERPHKPKNNQRQVFGLDSYYTIAKQRDKLFTPVAKVLSFLGFTANSISYLSVILMILFIFSIKRSLIAALALLGLSLLFDAFDGCLVRLTGTASDRGKFVDMVCDNVNFTLFIVGVTWAGLLSGLAGLLFAYFMLLSKLLRSVYQARFFRSDWHFKAVAGFVPNLFSYISYIAFLVLYLFNLNYLPVLSIVFSGLLAADSLFFFYKIVYKGM